MFAETEKVDVPTIRRTQRIVARLRLSVSGKIDNQTAFEEESYTIALNGDGGVLQLRTPVKKGQVLSLFHATTEQQAFCKVAHVGPADNGFATVRVQFLEAHSEFWNLASPPDDWTIPVPLQAFNLSASAHN